MSSTARHPDFLYIGPDKSGSSWLFKVLEQHPECFVPKCKDIYFFDNYYERGLDWYLSFFRDCPQDARAAGEISHGYLFEPQAPARILADFPAMKILTTLRNPVERSISHYFYLRSSGLIDCDFFSAIKVRPGILKSSLYYEPLKCFMDAFPAQQIKINYFEDLMLDPQAFAYDVFSFLGLSATDYMNFGERVREARKPKSFMLARMLKLAAIRARDMGFTNLVGRIKNSRAITCLYSPLDKKDKEQVSAEVREYLYQYFADDVLRLQDLLGKDLSHWLPESRRSAVPC